MGERGPAPKPTKLRILEGNPSHRPLPKNEPQPSQKAPPCPSWLPLEGKREWKRVAPELERLGLLTKVDGSALAAYCAAYARWRAAEKAIAEDGIIITTLGRHDKDGSYLAGNLVQHPAVGIANKAMEQIRAFCKEFGLTPSARSRLSLPSEPEESDPLERMLSGV